MSKSLVRASLDLVALDNDLIQEKKKKKNRSKGALDLIPANHRIIQKNKKTDSVIFNRTKKITVHTAKKQLAAQQDPTEENIRRLLLLSSSHLDTETADQLFNRAVSKRSLLLKTSNEEESTAFTEEDFKKFEEEYMAK